MYFRNFSIAALVSLLASGAWYYKGNSSSEVGSLVNNSPTSSPGLSAVPQVQQGVLTLANGYSTSPQSNLNTVSAEQATESTRKALVVENDQFYTGDIIGDEPISKYTDESGRRVLEMLTPEQATRKLRRNEESYLVGRGRGVVRYDVVQLPSNDPIEDDHAEKIVEVPQTVAATQDGTSSSDWMFWGVFDGHRFVDWFYFIVRND